KITFQESSEEFLADGTGINFVFSEMKESLLGFASHGGNVHLKTLSQILCKHPFQLNGDRLGDHQNQS
ncbi:hypothetical protein ACI3PW_11850, partial [Glaesserella parasuis]